MGALLFWIAAAGGVLGLFFVLIFIHELGHYWVGRLFGVGVQGFSIGFGPIIWSRTDGHGTLWALRLLPLGGFVQFAGDPDATSRPNTNPMDERADALASIAVWKRALIVAAGPAANITLAFVLATAHFALVGKDVFPPVLSGVGEGSAAQALGFQSGDRITHFHTATVGNVSELSLGFEARLGQQTQLRYLRDGQPRAVQIIPVPGGGELPSLIASGFEFSPRFSVGKIRPESPAQRMGLKSGDIITAYNGIPLVAPADFRHARTQSIGEPMVLSLRRGDQHLELSGIPEPFEVKDRNGDTQTIGVFGFDASLATERQRYGLKSVQLAMSEIQAFSTLILKLPAQFIARVRGLDDLGGPVRIAEEVGQVAAYTPYLLLYFGALISLQLGILNLLPIPVLDGGHLMIYAMEAIGRRPLPPQVVDFAYRLGFLVLISFFLFVTFNDLRRLIPTG